MAQLTKYAFGLVLLFFVVLLWVGSSDLIQIIYSNENFDHPFFLTYFSNGLFVFYLCVRGVQAAVNRTQAEPCAAQAASGHLNKDSEGQEPALSAQTHSPTSSHESLGLLETQGLAGPTGAHDKDSPKHGVQSSEPTAAVEQLSFKETSLIALQLCPVWFALNYTFNYSLSKTSLASNTILSSTSGLWTLVLSLVVLKQRFVWANALGVAATIAGAVLVSVSDSGNRENDGSSESMAGDIWCLVSAVLYAVYTILLQTKIQDEERVDMPLVFGMIGLWNLVLLWPGFFIVSALGVESFVMAPPKVLGFLCLNGFFGTVLSDYLWARSVLLTSPVIATVGLTLTIPIAMVVDATFNHKSFGVVYIAGSVLVIAGFVLVNWRHSRPEPTAEHEGEDNSLLPMSSERSSQSA